MAVLSYHEKENYWYIHLKLPFSCKLCFDPLTYHGFEPLVKCKYYLVTMTTEVYIFNFTSQVRVLKVVYLSFSEPNGMKCWSMLTI